MNFPSHARAAHCRGELPSEPLLDDGMGFSLVPWKPVIEQRAQPANPTAARRDARLFLALLGKQRSARFDQPPRVLQFLLQQLGIRQHHPVIRCHDLGRQAFQCVPRQGVSLVCAQDQAHGRVLVGKRPGIMRSSLERANRISLLALHRSRTHPLGAVSDQILT